MMHKPNNLFDPKKQRQWLHLPVFIPKASNENKLPFLKKVGMMFFILILSLGVFFLARL